MVEVVVCTQPRMSHSSTHSEHQDDVIGIAIVRYIGNVRMPSCPYSRTELGEDFRRWGGEVQWEVGLISGEIVMYEDVPVLAAFAPLGT